MKKLLQHQKWLPILWAFLAAAILALDFWTGPLVASPYLFLFPVSLAARFNGRRWGLAFAIVLPLVQIGFHFLWTSSWTWLDILSNTVIRILVLAVVACMVDLVTRQAREIRVLEGILPICSLCKKIRTSGQQWEQMESYITRNSEAKFSHTFCPECAAKYYKELGLDSREQKR